MQFHKNRPMLTYNPEPFHSKSEAKKVKKEIFRTFLEFFKTDTIITSKRYSEDLMYMFLEYVKTKDISKIEDYEKYIKEPDFPVCAFSKRANKDNVDIGLLACPDQGILHIYNYKFFRNIFLSENYKSIPDYKECIYNMVQAPNISPLPITKVFNEIEDKCKFIKIFEDLFDQKISNLDDFLFQFKSHYYSAPDKIIQKCIDIVFFGGEPYNEPLTIDKKVGRNEPCPCGSGKKFKKCCVDKVNIA
jgi:hypothetical protein